METEMKIGEIGSEMARQSNRGTQGVMFMIQEQRERLGVDNYDDIDSYKYRLCEDHATEDFGEGEVVEEGDASLDCEDLHDCYRCETLPVVVEYVDCTEKTGVFFTEKAAQRHIDENYYHYKKPRIYGVATWRNDEMQAVQRHLLELSGEDVPSHYS